MKKVLALSIAAVMTVGFASHAFAGTNPNISLALDMQAKSKTRSCATMVGVYSSCSVINQNSAIAPGSAVLDVVPVVYNFQGITAVEYGLDWGSTAILYAPVWTKCSDLEITRVGASDFSTALVWNNCLSSAGGTSGAATGFLRFTVYAAGAQQVDFKPADSGNLGSVDCAFSADPIHTVHAGSQGGIASGLPPCTLGPTATEQTTWSGVKALYR